MFWEHRVQQWRSVTGNWQLGLDIPTTGSDGFLATVGDGARRPLVEFATAHCPVLGPVSSGNCRLAAFGVVPSTLYFRKEPPP
jgi:hypothetical protein